MQSRIAIRKTFFRSNARTVRNIFVPSTFALRPMHARATGHLDLPWQLSVQSATDRCFKTEKGLRTRFSPRTRLLVSVVGSGSESHLDAHTFAHLGSDVADEAGIRFYASCVAKTIALSIVFLKTIRVRFWPRTSHVC